MIIDIYKILSPYHFSEFVSVLLANAHLRWPAWMGFNDQVRENNFVWIDNSLADFTYWGPHQPDENKADKRPQARVSCSWTAQIIGRSLKG